MTSQTSGLILLTQSQLFFSKSSDRSFKKAQVYDWDSGSLEKVFGKIQQKTSLKSLEIILTDNLAITHPVFVETEAKEPEKLILKKFQEYISTPIDQLGVEWEFVETINLKDAYTVFAVQKKLLTLIGQACQNLSLKVTSIKPLGFVLANQLEPKDQPSLIVWTADLVNVFAVNHSQLIAQAIASEQNVYNTIPTLISFIEENYKLKPVKLIMAKQTKNPKKPADFDSELVFSNKDLNPFSNDKQKQAIFSDDSVSNPFKSTTTDSQTDQDKKKESEQVPDQEENLDISTKAPKLPLSVKKEDSSIKPSHLATTKGNKTSAKLFLVLVIIVVVLGGIVGGGVLVYQNAVQNTNVTEDNTQIQTPVVVDQSPTPLPSPTPDQGSDNATGSAETVPEELDKAQISINILNGSGVAGAAGSVEDILNSADFTDTDTGNADSYEYENTVVSAKPDSQDFATQIITLLEDSYTIEEGDPLDEDADYDIEIIVGQN